MATTSTYTKTVVRLPRSENTFFAKLKAHGCSAKFATGTLSRHSKFPIELQPCIYYSYPGLAHGRPLSKVMIVLVGQSGAGKSTTINALFNDQICETSRFSSQTRTVTEYGKELCVKDPNSPSVVATLSFVDLPGALDVDQTKEATNFANISKFRYQNSDLRPRKLELRASSIIREHVYPNVVLMVIHAADNRMDGPDSNLRKCLRAVEKYSLIDRLYPNLIVVVTHAMTIPVKCYSQETKLITHVIQEAIFNVLRLKKVQVVFVENIPEKYDLVKPEGYDFYQLPDGRLSHYNLIRAMVKQFDETGDDLGKLLCGWYFSDSCPEKQSKANILTNVEYDALTPDEIDEALQMLASINSQLKDDNDEDDIAPPKFNFQYLGHGFCAKTESAKSSTVFPEANTVKAELLNRVYTVPESFQFADDDDDHFLQISFVTKSSYENRRATIYGLENELKLAVGVDPDGRWIKDNGVNRKPFLRAVYEKRLLSARIVNPESSVKKELQETINNLPKDYNHCTIECFREFFNIWGSHFVHETWIGGYVIADCQVRATTHTEKHGIEMHSKIRTVFESIINLRGGDTEYISSPEGSFDKTIQKCYLSVEGGDPPQVSTLKEFTAVRYADWVETLRRYPVELKYSVKLTPYYKLSKDYQGRKALTQATQHFLDGTMPLSNPLVTSPRDNEISPKEVEEDQTFEEVRHIGLVTRNEIATRLVENAQKSAKLRINKCSIL